MQLKVYHNGFHYCNIRVKITKAELAELQDRTGRKWISPTDLSENQLSIRQANRLAKDFSKADYCYNVRLYE